MKHNTNLRCKAVSEASLVFTQKALPFLGNLQNNFLLAFLTETNTLGVRCIIWFCISLTLFVPTLFFFFKLPATNIILLWFSPKFDAPPNIFCYDYMNILFTKIKNRASAFKLFCFTFYSIFICSCFITTWMLIGFIRNTTFWTKNWEKMHFYLSIAFSSKIYSDVIFFHL